MLLFGSILLAAFVDHRRPPTRYGAVSGEQGGRGPSRGWGILRRMGGRIETPLNREEVLALGFEEEVDPDDAFGLACGPR